MSTSQNKKTFIRKRTVNAAGNPGTHSYKLRPHPKRHEHADIHAAAPAGDHHGHVGTRFGSDGVLTTAALQGDTKRDNRISSNSKENYDEFCCHAQTRISHC
jgi:hypothetical protein